MTLRTTNLNLLPILRALLHEGNTTRAAEQLGLSQPATSNALARLRILLGDPLLVPVGRSLRLTPRAARLRPEIERVCDAIEALLSDSGFDPARADRRFVIGAPDYLASLLGPALLRRFAQGAPGVSVRFTDISPDFRQSLLAGQIDIAVIVKVDDVVRGFEVADGFLDRMVGVVARDHPLAASPPKDAAELRAFPRIGLDLGMHDMRPPSELAALADQDGRLPQLTASHLRVLPLLIAQTDGVAIMPEAFARAAASLLGIGFFNLPDPAPPLELCMMWSPVLDSDPAHRWFRGELEAAMRLHFGRRGVAESQP